MQTIDAINDMLAFIGEAALDPTDPDYNAHPLYESALRVLTTAGSQVQAKGWWFNMRRAVLTPVLGTITIASDVLAVEVLDVYGDSHDYTIRNGKLFDLTDNTDGIAQPVTVNMRSLIAFDQLPETAARYVAARATTRFVRTYDGDARKIADAKDEELLAFIAFNADHIRNARVNLYQDASTVRALARSWFGRYQPR